MSTNKITKNLLEAANSVLTGQKLQEAAYIDKKNHKASNINQLEDLIAAELDLGGVDQEDLENLLTHFKKGYSIAVAVGAADKRELKKDGYVPGPFAIYKDMDERNQEIYIKAPAGMKESTESLQEASYIDKKNHKASNINQLEDLIAAELDLGGVDQEDLENLLTHFKKGYSIAVAVGAADKRELKKDGYVPGPFAIYKDMDERNQEIYIKAP